MKSKDEGCTTGKLPGITANALNRQVGGDHYKCFATQPVEFIVKNKLGFLPGSVVKRMCRYNKPTGKGLQDLQKAKHEIDLLIQLEEWEEEEAEAGWKKE